ncbi:MAG: thiamine pyrophosphate-dependent enzyme, partial [Burkholderiaceae bacterium]|nr:thiamine pyrophosphate-dependent enzyme [Burkholderiaceae bacterium]
MTEIASAVAPGMIDAKDGTFAREMLGGIAFIRAFETKVHELGKTTPPEIAGSAHLCAGQEVVPLAAMAALRDSDPVIATYRGHGWALASGLDPSSVMAELCHRAAGINGGRAGSAYFMAPEQRFIGENSIVGAGVPIACGVAMSLVQAGEGNVVIVSIGDGAMNQGSVHEALVFAAYKRLPVILICENNGWSELTPISRIVRVERLARRGLTYGIEGSTVDGTDPIAVRRAVAHAAARARAGEGPALIECKVPRLWGHYNRDIEHYRPREDSREAAARDPLKVWAQRLTASGLMSAAEVDRVIASQDARVADLAQSALAAPRLPVAAARDHVVSTPQAGAPARSQEPRSEAREMSYIGAVNAALRDELAADPRTVVYGEDLGHAGGIFGASKGLQLEFGDARVFDTPIAESAILGSGVGAAMTGLKPIVEIMWADFMLVALDQLVNQAANVRYVTGGKTSVPMVVRTQQGATPGSCPQHSQSLEALLTHIPGLKVALPATPQDAYDILREAAADPDPCIVIEARGLYGMKALVHPGIAGGRPGRARLHREGADVAIVTWGAMLHQALDAAARLATEGI